MDICLKVKLPTIEEMEAVRMDLLEHYAREPLTAELLQRVAAVARERINQMTVVEVVPTPC